MVGRGIHEYAWEGRGGPFTILLQEEVFAPTHTSREVAEGLIVMRTWSVTAPHGPVGSLVVSVSVTPPAAISAALGV